MIVAVMLFLAGGSARVYGQEACTFTQGFAEIRRLVGEQKVGACLEDEHFNPDNGNAEQRTTGGLMVWRKVDNFTAFTDGGTTWVNGPNGLQSRPNGERLSWERDPVTSAGTPASPTPRPLPTLPVTDPSAAPRVVNDGGTISTPNYTVQGGSGNTAPPPPPAAVPPPAAGNAPSATAATPTPSGTPTTAAAGSAGAAISATPSPSASAGPNTVAAAPAASATRSPATPTKSPTPKPAVTAKFTDQPDEVDTGSDAKFEVQTSAKKGTCALTVAYRSSSEVGIGTVNIDDDGRCEWKFTVPADTKTGKAKAIAAVSANGESAKVEDTFEVKKGDTVYGGSIAVEVDPTDMPKDVDPGEEITVGVDTNLKRKGSCALTMTWPKLGPVTAETQMPDDSGKCSWKLKVPADVPTKSTGSLVVTVHKDSNTYRTLTREFKVAK